MVTKNGRKRKKRKKLFCNREKPTEEAQPITSPHLAMLSSSDKKLIQGGSSSRKFLKKHSSSNIPRAVSLKFDGELPRGLALKVWNPVLLVSAEAEHVSSSPRADSTLGSSTSDLSSPLSHNARSFDFKEKIATVSSKNHMSLPSKSSFCEMPATSETSLNEQQHSAHQEPIKKRSSFRRKSTKVEWERCVAYNKNG